MCNQWVLNINKNRVLDNGESKQNKTNKKPTQDLDEEIPIKNQKLK